MSTVLSDSEARRNISSNILRLLKERGISQAELARRAKEPAMNVSRVVKRINTPNAAMLARLAEVLEVSVDYLLGNHEKKSRHSA